MDWLIWVFGGILLIGFIVGIWKGALRIAVSLLTVVLTVVITFLATPFVAAIVLDKTPLDEAIKDHVVTTMTRAAEAMATEEAVSTLTEDEVRQVFRAAGVTDEKLAEYEITVEDVVAGKVSSHELKNMGISSELLKGVASADVTTAEDVMEKTEVPRDLQIKAIEMAELPEVFKSILNENNNDEIYGELGVETFAQYVGVYLAKLLIHIASFIGVFLLVTIILRAIIFALDIVNDIPVFGLINRLAGGVAGLGGALVVVWFIFLIVTTFYSISIVKEMYDVIQANEFLKLIYDNNPILEIAVKMK